MTKCLSAKRSTLQQISLLLIFAVGVFCDITDAPATTEMARVGAGIDNKTKASYEKALQSLKDNKRKNPDRIEFNAMCSGCNLGCMVGCMRPCPTDHGPPELAKWAGKTTHSISATMTPKLPAPPASIVTATAPPLWTVIVRADSDSQTEAAATKPEAEVSRHATDSAASVPLPGTEITDAYYAVEMSGQHGGAISLVTANNAGEPVSLFAYANSTLFSSFISSSLVDELDLTDSIVPSKSVPMFTPERDLSGLLGYKTYPLGELSLDVLVGVNDRIARDVKFTVLHAPGKETGWWRVDLLVGIAFLNDIQALQLTDEYTGSHAAGAKDGLGVLVQRVFKGKESDGGKREHDEL